MDETYVTDVAGECFHIHDCDDDTDHDTDHDTDDDIDDDTTLKKSETFTNRSALKNQYQRWA